jgi:hypothetical protein
MIARGNLMMRSVATMTSLLFPLPGAASEDPIEAIPCAFLPIYFDVGSAKLRDDAVGCLITGYYETFDVYNPATDACFLLTSYSADGGSKRASRRLARCASRSFGDSSSRIAFPRLG